MFYSEAALYLKYLRAIMDRVATDNEHSICYVTSDPADPLLSKRLSGIQPFCISAESALIAFFETLNAGVLVMTVPDLGTFHVKRSAFPATYAFVHHSMVSTHMVYRKGAFDQFDAILCVGPYHAEETRQWEKAMGLTQKALLEHGYGPLDDLLRIKPTDYRAPAAGSPLKVLVAPSWGENGLIEKHGETLTAALLAAGHAVTVRPHPRTGKLWPEAIDRLRRRFTDTPGFQLEESIATYDSLLDADVMISDWSGAALEFAFGLERPVLYVDVPRKVNNPDYEAIAATPLEVAIRGKIGAILPGNRIADVAEELGRLVARHPETIAALRRLRDETFFNVGNSAAAAATAIDGLAKSGDDGK